MKGGTSDPSSYYDPKFLELFIGVVFWSSEALSETEDSFNERFVPPKQTDLMPSAVVLKYFSQLIRYLPKGARGLVIMYSCYMRHRFL